ncbi:MAG: signal peptidase I [Candidatus Aenigmatarchaeota archaeon]|nr:signal peptidase I [Candidatus Aenigmarchaeota archaeon]
MLEKFKKIYNGKYGIILQIILGAISAYIIYFFILANIFHTDAVFSSVFSNSMIPVFFRGDLMIVYNDGNFKIGDIVVYESNFFPHPIIHRIIAIEDGKYITKGDNNLIKDPYPITKEQIKGKVIFKFPLLGYVKIFAEEGLNFIR